MKSEKEIRKELETKIMQYKLADNAWTEASFNGWIWALRWVLKKTYTRKVKTHAK